MRRGLFAIAAWVAILSCGRSGFDSRGVPLTVSVRPIVGGAILEWDPPFRTEVQWLAGTSEVGFRAGAVPPVTIESLVLGTTYSFVVADLPAVRTAPLAQPLLSPFPVWFVDGTALNAAAGSGLASAGDVDGDGDAEIIVAAPGISSARVYDFGATSPRHEWVMTPGTAFGRWVDNAGDIDGDGFEDVLVGEHAFATGTGGQAGRLHLYRGTGTGLEDLASQILTGLTPGEHFGVHVAGAGDVDGDGFGDAFVSAHIYSQPEANEGILYLLRGSASGLILPPLWSVQANVGASQLGVNSGNLVGDVDGDGIDDVGVGAYPRPATFQQEGRALVFKGGNPPATTPLWTYDSGQQDAFYGISIDGADFNGDGYSDLITGAFGWDDGGVGGDAGRLDIFLGSPAGPALAPSRTWVGREQDAQLGVDVAVLGDVNADGLPDAVVGAYAENDPGVDDGGAVYLYLGTAGAYGLEAQPAWRWAGDQSFAYAGVRVEAGGDVNGDGAPDLLVGATNYDQNFPDTGRAYVFLGREPRSGARVTAGVLVVTTTGVAVPSLARIEDLSGARHRCTWEWGDGTPTDALDPCPDPSLVTPHDYPDGLWMPKLTVTSFDGRRSEALGFVLVATSATQAALLPAPPGP